MESTPATSHVPVPLAHAVSVSVVGSGVTNAPTITVKTPVPMPPQVSIDDSVGGNQTSSNTSATKLPVIQWMEPTTVTDTGEGATNGYGGSTLTT